MPAWLLVWASKVGAFLWESIRRNPLAVVLVLLLIGQQFQLWQGRRENTALWQTIEAQKTEMASMRSAIQKLTDAAAALRPGETRTIYVDRPVMVHIPGETITKEVPVVVTRTEKTIETKVEVLRVPGETIREFVERSPQSIIATMTALRDIPQGEKFSATFVQLQPGVWQPMVTPDSPVGIEARVITPIERIPRPPAVASPWAFSVYAGWSSVDAWVAGARARYALSHTWAVEGQAERRFTPGLWEYRLLAVARF